MRDLARFHLPFLALTWLTVHILLFWHYGIRTTLFDAREYIEGADYVLKRGSLADFHHLFYSLPITLIAFFRFLFPGEILPFLLFQCFFSGLAAWALYWATANIFRNTWAGFFSAFIFLIWWDNIQWNTTTMTESLFQTIVCFIAYILTRLEKGQRNYGMLVLLLVALFLTRPTSVVIIASVLVFLAVSHMHVLRGKPVVKTMITGIVLLCLLLGAESMLLHWDFTEEFMKGNIVTYADYVEGTPVSYDIMRMDTSGITAVESTGSPVVNLFSFVFANPLYFVTAGALKIWFLISATRPYYSVLHNIYSIGWLMLIYTLCVFGWKAADNQNIRLFSLAAIVLNCLLIGISSVDWDNRFYIPMAPGIILLAGGGASFLRQRILTRLRL